MDNRIISVSSGLCEGGRGFGTREASMLGRRLSGKFPCISLGCDGFSCLPLVYALCSGASEGGSEVLLCENTDLPSLRFGGKITGADCTVFVSGRDQPQLHFFGKTGFPLSPEELLAVISAAPSAGTAPGAIRQITSFRGIYVGSIAESLGGKGTAIPSMISCAGSSVRSLWLEFFTGRDSRLVFQVSANGRSACAYMADKGYIPGETLMIAYACQASASGETVWLPEELHFAADSISGDIRRFPADSVPPAATAQRFLTDPLYMCAALASDMERFRRTLSELPAMTTVRRELSVGEKTVPYAEFSRKSGRVLTRSAGPGRLAVIAQSYSAETASELCADWCRQFRGKKQGK